MALPPTLESSSSPVAPGVHPGLFLGFSCWLRGVSGPAGHKAFSFLSILTSFLSLHLLKHLWSESSFSPTQWPQWCPRGSLPWHVCPRLSQPSGCILLILNP